jgi:phospholipid-translocating ATPase
MVLLQTSGDSGSCFIRTEQLDGETDWKLRLSVPSCQTLGARVCEFDGIFNVEEPHKNIYSFFGTISRESDNDENSEIERVDPIGLDNTVWANTVLASNGYIIGAVIYTGRDTRAALNTNNPQTKIGIFDLEVNQMSKILCFVTLVVSFSLISINGFQGTWYIYLIRFLILFSSIIPISLKVNMDMGKVYYSRCISRDSKIANTIVRSSTIPEELGRIEYLLTDKTGTLTQNLMELQKLHLGTIKFDESNMAEVSDALSQLNQVNRKSSGHSRRSSGYTHLQSDQVNKIGDLVEALALCHTVSPIYDQENNLSYQPSSPDEGAIIEWTRKVGLTLVGRDPSSIEIENLNGVRRSYKILQTFPFSSETKRMGIILKSENTDQITFFIKGADSIMSKLVKENDWLEDACDSYAGEGLRTLVIGKKHLTEDQYSRFEKEFHEASVSLQNRRILMQNVISHHLERNLDLLGLTGVEDKLQDQVTNTLESLRTAGIKIWMLTGDKVETAICIARSSNLCYQGQTIHKIVNLRKIYEAQNELELLQNQAHTTCLVIDGQSLQFYLSNMKLEFIKIATNLACVVCCRCSPTQKAEITQLIKNYTKKRTLAIGDGGNDVSMIQMANVGVGIVGKEGKQASLAADFSVEQFSALTRLLLWHGRNSYKRSAKISLFIIHRGLIISTMQVVFSAIFYFSPIALFQGVLLVGYTTLYTNFPVFALVLDSDITEDIALMYPELYKDLTKVINILYT